METGEVQLSKILPTELDDYLKKNTVPDKKLQTYIRKHKALKGFLQNPSEGLYYAVTINSPFLTRHYVNTGANLNYYQYSKDIPYRSLLEHTLKNKMYEIADILLDSQDESTKIKTQYGLRELIMFILENDADNVLYLLKHGISPNQQSFDGKIPLMNAVYLGYFPIVKILVDNGATVDLADSKGVTPLMIATSKGFTDIVKYLLTHGANPHYIDDEHEMSAVDIAKKLNNKPLLKILNQKV